MVSSSPIIVSDATFSTVTPTSKDDELVGIGEASLEFGNAPPSPSVSLASPLTEKDTMLDTEMKTLISTAQAICIKARKAISAKGYLLSIENDKPIL